MTKNYFDEVVARRYDERNAHLESPEVIEPTVEVLTELTGTGPALEFGVGTGRVALALVRRGVRVHGVELSPEMVARMRAKPEGDEVTVTMGDFASTKVPGTFNLVYLLRNTITNLTTQDAQVACFANAAAHLEAGGSFVIEVYVPELRRLPPGESFYAFDVTPTHVGVEEYEVATQIAYSHHWWIEDGAVDTFSAPFRYVWPSELDLMARLAGLELRERWSDWHRAPFTNESRAHVSIWQKSS